MPDCISLFVKVKHSRSIISNSDIMIKFCGHFGDYFRERIIKYSGELEPISGHWYARYFHPSAISTFNLAAPYR